MSACGESSHGWRSPAWLLPTALAGQTLAIEGGAVHPMTGSDFVGTVVVRDGLIVDAGADVAAPVGARVIDATGLHVYPGLFDAWSNIGLIEISAISATVDTSEIGDTPHLLAVEGVHPASEMIPVARANGITHSMTAPSGGPWAGQASAIVLDGWTVEEMAVEPSVGLVLEWPNLETREFDFSTFSVRERSFSEAKKDYDRTSTRSPTGWMPPDSTIRRGVPPATPARWKGTTPWTQWRGWRGASCRCWSWRIGPRAIRDAVAFAERHGLDLVIASGRESAAEAELLAEHDVPVILGPVQALPVDEDDPYDRPYRTPGELAGVGVRIAFGTFSASNARALPYEAATAVAHGLDADARPRADSRRPPRFSAWRIAWARFASASGRT